MDRERYLQLDRIARHAFEQIGRMTVDGLDSALADCTDDILMDWPFGPAERLDGRAAIKTFLRANTVEGFELNLEDVFVDPVRDVAILTANSRGHNQRTGKDYANRYVFLLKFRDDLICEWHEYLNPIAVLEAFGPAA